MTCDDCIHKSVCYRRIESVSPSYADKCGDFASEKTGHWIYSNFNWRCSECNETPKTLGYVGTADFMTEHFKFCNHCGARMVESQESEG